MNNVGHMERLRLCFPVARNLKSESYKYNDITHPGKKLA